MRSLAEQTAEEMGGPWSVLTRQKRDHVELDRMLRELETGPVEDQPELLQRIYRLVFPHAFAEEAVLWPAIRRALPDGEEDNLLPRLQERLTSSQLRRLGVTWETLRRTAPTRAHPVVARRPPGNALSALPLTVIDRSRDRLDRAARRNARWRPPLRTTSRVLGGWAAAVERVELLRRGERPETRTP